MKLFVPILSASLALASLAFAQAEPILGERERGHVERALDHLNMSVSDLGFDKDVAEPVIVFDHIRHLLAHPLELTELGDDLLGVLDDPDALWAQFARLLEVDPPGEPQRHDQEDALQEFLLTASAVTGLLHRAYQAVSREGMEYAAGRVLGAWLKLEDNEADRELLLHEGVSQAIVNQLIAEEQSIDPEPAARRLLDIIDRIDYSALVAAGRLWHDALHRLAESARTFDNWPDDEPDRIETDLGLLIIGTPGDDMINESAVLILNPGGDNTYRGRAGAASGLNGSPLAAIIDLSGNDIYRGTHLLGPGAALFGLATILDLAGDDLHHVEYAGQGAGLFGIGWLEDHGGTDTFRAGFLAQGAGYAGLGVLRQHKGNSLYEVAVAGQGFAGVRGIGLLLDDGGNDVYIAGGRFPDHERHQTRYLSLAQGCSIGMRPFAGGGYGFLVDRSGNDSYVADIYGQGVSYWYSVGMLLDPDGNDTYTVHHYGQGSGIHLSLGLLYDGGGNDKYTGYILVQGNAHDYGVGILVDRSGDDTYTADHHAQGRAINNSFALLLDGDGNDAYLARQPDQAQGIGNDGDLREYPSVALLLDVGGHDVYSSGATNNAVKIRPDVGILYDVAEPGEDRP